MCDWERVEVMLTGNEPMTDLKPGSRWLLPVTIDEIDGCAWARTSVTENAAICIQENDFPSLIPADRITELEAEVARLRADLAYERRINGREAERIFVASLLADEIEVLTNSPSSFDVQDGIALTAFQKRLIGLWRVRDSLPAPSEKEAG